MRTFGPSLLVATLALTAPAAAQPRQPPARPPAAEPAPEPAAETTEPATEPVAEPTAASDVDTLRQEYLTLRDKLFRSRARAAAVASALYSSKLRVVIGYDSGRHHTVTRASVRLDGASVYDDSQGELAKGAGPRFDGFVAPGRHMLTLRIEATAKDDERFSTATESTFVVQVPPGKDVIVTATAEDDGDIGYEWKKSERGSYQLRLAIAIKSEKRATPPRPQATLRSRDASRHATR